MIRHNCDTHPYTPTIRQSNVYIYGALTKHLIIISSSYVRYTIYLVLTCRETPINQSIKRYTIRASLSTSVHTSRLLQPFSEKSSDNFQLKVNIDKYVHNRKARSYWAQGMHITERPGYIFNWNGSQTHSLLSILYILWNVNKSR